MKVNPTRRVLWVATGAQDLMVAPQKAEAGLSAVLGYDLSTETLMYRFAFGPPPNRLANDLAIDRHGTVFVTDTDAGAVYRIDPAKSEVDTLMPPGSLFSPNGIAVSPDGTTLFVATWLDGVWRIDVATRSRFLLPQVGGPRPTFIDGLYLRGRDLIGITSILSQGRVGRFTLSDRLDRIDEYQELECNHPAFDSPTTRVVVATPCSTSPTANSIAMRAPVGRCHSTHCDRSSSSSERSSRGPTSRRAGQVRTPPSRRQTRVS
jgi:sugar lactone lactonase YvrE